MQDALSALQVLVGRLGRNPTLVELLRELSADPAGMPVQGVNDPGYAACPAQGSALLGDVPCDESLTAALQVDDLVAGAPELLRAREDLVRGLLFGDAPAGPGPLLGPGPGGRRPAMGGHARAWGGGLLP